MGLANKYWRRCYFHCLWGGCTSMCVALLLHPMSPKNFLALALAAPLDTIRDAYGIQAAVLFWLSAAVIAFGIAGLAGFGRQLRQWRISRRKSLKRVAHLHPDSAEENWIFL